jgi:hypothetical protein
MLLLRFSANWTGPDSQITMNVTAYVPALTRVITPAEYDTSNVEPILLNNTVPLGPNPGTV